MSRRGVEVLLFLGLCSPWLEGIESVNERRADAAWAQAPANPGSQSHMDKASWTQLRAKCLDLRSKGLDGYAGGQPGVPVPWQQMDCDFLASLDTHGVLRRDFSYRYLNYGRINQRLRILQQLHPDLVSLYTTQGKYGLESRGQCFGSPYTATKEGCQVWVLELGKRDLRNSSPQIFFSGALHGNERIGPTALIELASYMLGRYEVDPWMKYLLENRRIVIMPSANAIGYSDNTREELKFDPNRDFAFDIHPAACMRTVTARSINEVFKDHIFQLMVTFHGGDNLIAFPWGDTKHCPGFPKACNGGRGSVLSSWITSDHTAMAILAKHVSTYSGPQPEDGKLYRNGPLNDPRIIYPVGGGMEDWAYGASWSQGRVECHGDRSYNSSRSKYSDATHRTVNLLIEASSSKIPLERTLGESVGVRYGNITGHIPRNIRLSLMSIDVLQPYVILEGIWTSLQSGPVSTEHFDAKPGQELWVQWKAGGGFWINQINIKCTGQSLGTKGELCLHELEQTRSVQSPEIAPELCGQKNNLNDQPCYIGSQLFSCQWVPEV